MKNPICEQSPEIKAFADGELGFWRSQSIKRHLKSCPKCQQELIWMQKISEELNQETAPLGAELRARILENAPESLEMAPRPKNRRRAVKKLSLALAGAAILAVGAQNLVSQSQNSGALAPDSVSAPRVVENWNFRATDERASGKVGEKTPIEQNQRLDLAAGAAPSFSVTDETKALESQVQKRERRSLDGSNYAFSDGHARLQNGVTSGNANELSGQNFNRDSVTSTFANPGFVPAARAVHREGSVAVAVDNAETASDAVTGLVKKSGGFVASNQLSTQSDGKRAATLDCRVPVGKFEDLIAKIGSLGTVRAKNVNGEDITAQIARATARKVTLGRELSIGEARLKKREKTAKKRDENSLYYQRLEVRNLRVQASQARAALETLRKYGDLSTLFVTLNDRQKPVAPVVGPNVLEKTGAQAWTSFLGAAKLPLQLLIWILAYSPLWLPALIIWRKWGRKWLDA